MRRIPAVLALVAVCGVCSSALWQQGGNQQQNYEGQVRAIENDISLYLGGDENKNILTPGEYSEWPMTLKAGQVVVAEARSDAFDPAIEIVDDKGKVVGSNDDRYPGDQRPLILWRCGQDGAYGLRVRCFHDKSGGQVFLRFATCDSIDLDSDKMVERKFDKPAQFFLRIPMKAGQIKQIVVENPDGRKYTTPWGITTISPIGLPDAHLERTVSPPIPNIVVAPVDGDYYVLEGIGEPKVVRVGTREIMPMKPKNEGGAFSASAPIGSPALMAISVKAGDVLEAVAPELHLGAPIVIAEVPDFASFDLKKPETNPFFPKAKDKQVDKGPVLTILPGRARDSRIVVFVAKRDADLWLATSGDGPWNTQFTFKVRPAARGYAEGISPTNRLKIGSYDYWAFDAKVGDVMTFSSKATTFAQKIFVRDPDLGGVWSGEAGLDQTSIDWSMIAKKPGRYLVAISAMGDGGGGDYTLSRTVFSAKAFGKGSPASGDLADGQTHVWKFTANPGEPLLLHWKGGGEYGVSIRDESGADARLPLTRVDDVNEYGIIRVNKPTTYLIVLTAGRSKTSYSIELADIPGYVKGK